jgi:hypothetical protein
MREGHRWSVLNPGSFKFDCRVMVYPLPPLAEPKESAQSFELLETLARVVFPFGAKLVERCQLQLFQVTQAALDCKASDVLEQ